LDHLLATTTCAFSAASFIFGFLSPQWLKKENQRLVGPHHRHSAMLGTTTFATTPPFFQKLTAVRSPLPGFDIFIV